MLKKTKVVGSIGLALTVVFYVTILILPAEVEAKPQVVAVEGVSYNVNTTLKDNLGLLVGKRVEIAIDSGQSFTGSVKKVGNSSVHLEKLEGKSYFDALVQIKSITAISTRFRTVER